MSSRKQRRKLAERRIAHDMAVEKGRIARRSDLTAEEKETLEPKKKTVKSKNKASQKDK